MPHHGKRSVSVLRHTDDKRRKELHIIRRKTFRRKLPIERDCHLSLGLQSVIHATKEDDLSSADPSFNQH
jgi:hypothetical protein